ncbi:efflux RND transporter periplasmic adaptor subunit, partial [Geofilum rubicundum]|uniref:efflux RND transporter periplasmic adaptor subunit n=1 Tax=Geofilum rubicundum TaxID=472113 RepID=UPI00078507FF
MLTKSLALLVITSTFYACSSSKGGDDTAADAADAARLSYVEPPETRVEVTSVERGSFELELVSNGHLEAQRKAVVPFVVQEQIKAVHVREGERVNAGQLLGAVEPFTYQKRLDEALNRHQQSLIDLEDRLLGFGYRIQDSLKIPEDQLRMAKLRSGFNSAEISLEEARRNFETTSIKAPITGVVTNLEARVHNPSTAFQKFCDILDLSSMHLVFYLLETELAGVEQGQLVELRPFALQGEKFEGRVSSINPMVDEKG